MRTITTKTIVGKFQEWDEKTQAIIIDKHRDINTNHQWWDHMNYLLSPQGQDWTDMKTPQDPDPMPLKYNDIFFSFEDRRIEFKDLTVENREQADQMFKMSPNVSEECDLVVEYGRVRYYTDNEKHQENVDRSNEKIRDRMMCALKYLENTYYHIISDEAIKETLSCNDYEFDQEGNIY